MARAKVENPIKGKCEHCGKEFECANQANLNKTLGSHMARMHGIRGKFSIRKKPSLPLNNDVPEDVVSLKRRVMAQSVMIRHQTAIIDELSKLLV